MIAYEIERMDMDAHEFHVRMTVQREHDSQLLLRLPAWIPGSYMIRDFARHVTAIAASDSDGPVAITKQDKQTWLVRSSRPEVEIAYRVYAFDLSVRAAYLDRERAYFNGTSLFLRPDSGPHDWRLCLRRPDDPVCAEWCVATALPATGVDAAGFGDYAGQDIGTLYDCPVEIGVFDTIPFDVDGVPHGMVISHGGRFDRQRIAADLAPICAEHAGLFGELPIVRYLFLVLATAEGYGGLEHRDSSSLVCERRALPREGLGRADKAYRQFLGLASHEYFHLWNVKRIRPALLAAADLRAEVHTELLWAFEGITSYYDELALVRSGVLGADDYLDMLAGTVTRVMRGGGRRRQSIAESSFDAWTKFYKQDENAPNAIVSYYAKGALVAFGLDMEMRVASAERISLDDLMRALWRRFGRAGTGVPERGIEAVVADVVGRPLEGFFARYVYGTEELPLAEWFAQAGIGYRLRPALGPDDNGGNRAEAPGEPVMPALGARGGSTDEGLQLTHVFTGGAAQAAGLAAGDLLIAIDGERLGRGEPGALLQRIDGATARVNYFRRGRLLTSILEVRPPSNDTCDLWQLQGDTLDEDVRARRSAWWGSNRARGQ